MSNPKEVIIDGVLYVPVSESFANIRDVAKGIMMEFWGDLDDDEVDEKIDGLFVRVYDDGEGEPLSKVLANIANSMSSK